MKDLMKTLVAIVTMIAFLAASVPASAQEAISPVPAPSAKPVSTAKAPLFIARGTPLTTRETASMNQRMMLNGRISHDLGGDGDDTDAITKADEVFVGIIVVAAIGGLVYLTVLEAQNSSKLF